MWGLRSNPRKLAKQYMLNIPNKASCGGSEAGEEKKELSIR